MTAVKSRPSDSGHALCPGDFPPRIPFANSEVAMRALDLRAMPMRACAPMRESMHAPMRGLTLTSRYFSPGEKSGPGECDRQALGQRC